MLALKNSLNRIKINFKVIIAAALLMLCAVTLAYAYFSKEDSINLDYLKGANLDFDFDAQSVSSEVFQFPGDTYETLLTVENTGECAFTYRFEFTLTVPQSVMLPVLCYLDGKYLGTLYDLANGEGAESETVGGSTVYVFTLPFEMPLYMGRQASHNLTLEYHIGGGEYFNDKYFDLEINCKAKSLDKQTTGYIYVQGYQLGKALSRFSGYSGKRIILTEDCVLNEDTVIEYGVDIDLNGYQLNLNGKSLIYDFDDEGIFYIYSGISGGTVYGENITVNAPGAVVLNKGVFGESVNFAVTESGL